MMQGLKLPNDKTELLKKHKLTEEDYNTILDIIKREPNLLELGIFSAMWSEHCSYKSSKIYLKDFPTQAPWVIQGPGENAGVIDIGGGYAAVFKMESHNHPSFIEPYAGAATGVGGIMRDIFTMGARPVASLNSIRFGNLHTDKRHRYLLRNVVKGIGDYGNCMGVPTVGGELSTEECYKGNILVNAFTLGIAKSNEIFYAKAQGIGNPIIYVGSKTGRDGLGGAVMSSDSFKHDSQSLRPNVQLGDPFVEKLLLEACLELFKKDLIIGIQDMGAAGLTSSSFEMAGKSNSGINLYLDKVPTREEGMNPYEIMLSESQERMLICAKKGCEQEIFKIFDKWELDCVQIGEVCAGEEMRLFWHGELCAKIPIAPLSRSAPVLERPVKEIVIPNYHQVHSKTNTDTKEVFEALWGSLEISSKSWIYQQYDSSVQTNTLIHAEGDSSIIRIKENNTLLALSIGCNPRLCFLDPKEGAKRAVAKCGLEIAVRGAKPLALTDCLNFGSPENAEVMWQFRESCAGIKEAAQALYVPVVSGNVSLYNRSDMQEIYPTPSIAMVGILKDAPPLRSALKQEGNLLFAIGIYHQEIVGSLYQKIIFNELCGTLISMDLNKEKQLWDFLIQGNRENLFVSAKEVGMGGIAITLAKMALLGNKGVKCVLKQPYLFYESPTLVLAEINPSNEQILKKKTEEFELPFFFVGTVAKENVLSFYNAQWDLQELKTTYEENFEKVAEQL